MMSIISLFSFLFHIVLLLALTLSSVSIGFQITVLSKSSYVSFNVLLQDKDLKRTSPSWLVKCYVTICPNKRVTECCNSGPGLNTCGNSCNIVGKTTHLMMRYKAGVESCQKVAALKKPLCLLHYSIFVLSHNIVS